MTNVYYTAVFEANVRAYERRKYRAICNEGSTRCFAPDTLVVGLTGSIPINQIQPGQLVKTNDGFKPVSECYGSGNHKPTVRIKLKNGKEIVCTEDHKFYFREAWVSIKEILSLLDGNNMEADTGL